MYFRSSHLWYSMENLLKKLKNLWPNLLEKTTSEGDHLYIFSLFTDCFWKFFSWTFFGFIRDQPWLLLNMLWKHSLWWRIITSYFLSFDLTLSWGRPLSYRNQSIDLFRKSMDWFLYDISLRHEKVKSQGPRKPKTHFYYLQSSLINNSAHTSITKSFSNVWRIIQNIYKIKICFHCFFCIMTSPT